MKSSSIRTSILILSLIGCGGSGGGDDSDDVVIVAPTPGPTPILVTQCGDITVSVSQLPEIEVVAEEEGVDLSEIDAGPVDIEDFPCVSDGIQQCTKGIIIAACGSNVGTNDSITISNTTTTVNNPAERLIAAMRAGGVVSIEVRR